MSEIDRAGHLAQGDGRQSIQRELLQEVHRVAKIGTWELTSEGQLSWPDETLKLFGLSRSQFGGKVNDFYALVHPEDLDRVKRLSDFAQSSKTYFNSEYRIVPPDGPVRFMRQTAVVLRNPQGEPVGFSGVVQDVTEQVETQFLLRQAQKMETIGHLSGGIAHDFNNIIATIASAAELLRPTSPSDAELVDSILRSAERGSELTTRLLTFARKPAGREEQVSATECIQDISPMLSRLAGADIRVIFDLQPDVWPIDVERASLEEAMLNLVVNAIDGIEGAGTISIGCRNNTARDDDGENSAFVEITVKDDGSGMTADTAEKAVEPFFTTKPAGKGSGLGLSMVQNLVRHVGGKLSLQSALEEGTVVSLLFPKSDTELQANDGGEAKHTLQGRGQTVLIIEDNVELATLIGRQLRSLNYNPVIATDRNSAIAEADTAGGFDILLSDVLLANGERGTTVVKELVQRYPKSKAVFMTGYVSEDDIVFGVWQQNVPLLRKPFSMDKLAKTLGLLGGVGRLG